VPVFAVIAAMPLVGIIAFLTNFLMKGEPFPISIFISFFLISAFFFSLCLEIEYTSRDAISKLLYQVVEAERIKKIK